MPRTKKAAPFGGAKVSVVKPDHENDYGDMVEDVIGVNGEKLGDDNASDSGSDAEGGVYGKKKGGKASRRDDPPDDGSEQQSPYMLFDFRRGPDNWPKNCELVDMKRFDELLEKVSL